MQSYTVFIIGQISVYTQKTSSRIIFSSTQLNVKTEDDFTHWRNGKTIHIKFKKIIRYSYSSKDLLLKRIDKNLDN